MRTWALFVGALLLFPSLATSQISLPRMDPEANTTGGLVALTWKVDSSTTDEDRYKLFLENTGENAIFYATNPHDVCGNRVPYVSRGQVDPSVVYMQWRVFEIVLELDCYTNETRIELKRLAPGEKAEQKIAIKWPLKETSPPYFTGHDSIVEKSEVKILRFAVSYFAEEEGLLDFLTSKPFGWFVKGHERLEKGVSQGKRFYEIQQFASVEIPVVQEIDPKNR
jgi:hypothetical protein